MRLEPFTLTGRHVRLEPVSHDHVDDLVEAATADRSSFGYTMVPADRPAMVDYVDALGADAAAGVAVPFAQRRLDDGRVVGCTRFMSIAWWSVHDAPVEVEVGGTWLATSAQRSAINTEAKLLLLTHAFETWRVHRVAICTDARNTRSRVAIERLGATFEGILRSHRASMGDQVRTGVPRDTAMHSIIAAEWPAIRVGLEERLRDR